MNTVFPVITFVTGVMVTPEVLPRLLCAASPQHAVCAHVALDGTRTGNFEAQVLPKKPISVRKPSDTSCGVQYSCQRTKGKPNRGSDERAN